MFKDYNRTFFDEVSSTMQTIKGTSSPALHIAKSQTKGIGQYGRTWVSQPEKGIYLSLRNHVTMRKTCLNAVLISVNINLTQR